jgi:ribosomal protein RSM22 (predicted rRNA methylase)
MQLLRSPLVRPLDEPFRATLDDLARARGWPTSADIARAGVLVRKLSDAYNGVSDGGGAATLRTNDALAARLVFSFPRDVPKGAGAVRELVLTGALAVPEGRPLRVLDVGAGLGATSRGVVRALALRSAVGEVLVDAIDEDGAALDLAEAIARARPREGGVGLELRGVRTSAGGKLSAREPYDLIVLGQVLSELDRDRADGRALHHAELLRAYAERLRDDGSIVVVEPALRERTRHLHAVREALLALPGPGLSVFAPCVHDAPCPMLATEDGWCHEDLDVDLPPWLVPVARAAGLRWQGLTFSYLVLRRDGRRQTGAASRHALRVVSSPVVTKGKRELFLCGVFEGRDAADRRKVMRLDRHFSPENEAWDGAARGDVLELMPPVSIDHLRVLSSTTVARVSRGD